MRVAQSMGVVCAIGLGCVAITPAWSQQFNCGELPINSRVTEITLKRHVSEQCKSSKTGVGLKIPIKDVPIGLSYEDRRLECSNSEYSDNSFRDELRNAIQSDHINSILACGIAACRLTQAGASNGVVQSLVEICRQQGASSSVNVRLFEESPTGFGGHKVISSSDLARTDEVLVQVENNNDTVIQVTGISYYDREKNSWISVCGQTSEHTCGIRIAARKRSPITIAFRYPEKLLVGDRYQIPYRIDFRGMAPEDTPISLFGSFSISLPLPPGSQNCKLWRNGDCVICSVDINHVSSGAELLRDALICQRLPKGVPALAMLVGKIDIEHHANENVGKYDGKLSLVLTTVGATGPQSDAGTSIRFRDIADFRSQREIRSNSLIVPDEGSVKVWIGFTTCAAVGRSQSCIISNGRLFIDAR